LAGSEWLRVIEGYRRISKKVGNKMDYGLKLGTKELLIRDKGGKENLKDALQVSKCNYE
jgi:hypothetical protein